MILVIDYNVGNIKSVCNAFRHVGCDVKLSRERRDVERADGLVLPGVATFGYAVKALGSAALLVEEAALALKPVLGICVGYQMLFQGSCEYGRHKGLGLIRGNVVPLPAGQRVPHMGWNAVRLPENMDLFAGLGQEALFYFAHSFYAEVADAGARVALTDYGLDFPAAVQKGNVYGTQFHPEKSGEAGLKVLRNFADICDRGNRRC